MSARRGPGSAVYVLSLAAYALALLSKETALVFPAMLLAYGLLYDRGREWRRYVPPAILTVLWAVLYITVFRSVSDYEPTGFKYRAGIGHLIANCTAYLLTFVNLLTHRLEDLAMVGAVSHAAGTVAARLAFVACLVACAAHYASRGRIAAHSRRRRDAMAFGFAFFLIALSPYVILESRLFMRYGYVGHAGLAISVGGLMYCVAAALRRIAEKEAGSAGTEES
jgi:hypothetical protein